MDEFVAASGRKVRIRKDGAVEFGLLNGYLPKESVFDAEEFFQAKRDEELGRWRWPINPDVVAKELNGALVRIWNERNGNYSDYRKADRERFSFGDRGFDGAAAAYFEAHPERKPWEDAKPGEVWVFTYYEDIDVVACAVAGGPFVTEFRGVTGVEFNTKNSLITTARRIWPEDAA